MRISGHIFLKVHDSAGRLLSVKDFKNLTVNGALNALATGAGGGTDPFSLTPTIKVGSSTTPAEVTQTNILGPIADTGLLTSRTSTSSVAEIVVIFNPSVSRTYNEGGLFFGSTMWARSVIPGGVYVPANGYLTYTWQITFET